MRAADGVSPEEALARRYAGTVASEAFRLRIRARELDGGFPFDVQNIYRVIGAVSDPFLDAYRDVAEAADLLASPHRDLLGTPGRVFRYGHLFVSGTVDERGTPLPARAHLLARAARWLHPRLGSGVPVPGWARAAATACAPVDAAGARRVATLATLLREHADVSFYGQHDHAYEVAGPLDDGDHFVLCRRYHRLADVLGEADAVVVTRYPQDVRAEVVHDPMRGDFNAVPPAAACTAAAVLVGGVPAAAAVVDRLAARVEPRLPARYREIRDAGLRAGEGAVARLFCTELERLLASVWHDGEQRVALLRARVDERLDALHARGADPAHETWTDAYVARLRTGIAAVLGSAPAGGWA